MSRWLSSVGNLLDNLDGQVENVRDVLAEGRDSDDDDDDDDYDSEEDGSSEDGNDEDQLDLIEDGAALFKKAFNTFSAPLKSKDSSEDEDDKEYEVREEEEAVTELTTPKPPPPPPPASREDQDVQEPTIQTAANIVKDGTAKEVAIPPLRPSEARAVTEMTPAKNAQIATQTPPDKAEDIQNKPALKENLAARPQAPNAPQQTKVQSKGPTQNQMRQQQQNKPQQQQTASSKSATANLAPPPQQQQQQQQQKRPPPPPPKSKAPLPRQPAGNPPISGNSTKSGDINTNNKQQVLAEMRQLKKQVYNLQQELNAANKEIQAQRKELDQAATMVQDERAALKEEKLDLKEDHEEEIAEIKAEYEETIGQLKASHRQALKDLRAELTQEKVARQQEGGDLSQDLQDALAREKEALQQVHDLQIENNSLNGKLQKLELQTESLQEKLESALEAQNTATRRQQAAEVALDEAQEQHKRQLKQRQVREAELEKTIADLGTALTTAQQEAPPPRSANNGPSSSSSSTSVAGLMSPMPPFQPSGRDSDGRYGIEYKERYQEAMEEVDTLRGQLTLEQQRCDALRREIDEVAQERTQDAAINQERQRYYDQKMEEQSSLIARLELIARDQEGRQSNSEHDDSNSGNNVVLIQKLQRQLEEAKARVSSLSEQLLHQQGMSDVHKSEILALKGRLKAANARAEEAEKTAFQSPASTMVGGGGTYNMPRRIKGRRGNATIKSIRVALNMGPGSGMEGLGKTIEALDLWMIDTGNILRHEPLARLAFFVYFSILHLWCFCLVAFHTSSYETPHADFPSSLRGHRGVGVHVDSTGGP